VRSAAINEPCEKSALLEDGARGAERAATTKHVCMTRVLGKPLVSARMTKGGNAQESRASLIGRILALSSSMDHDKIQVNCGHCGKSMIVRLAEIHGKRLVDCEDCERAITPTDVARLVRDQNAIP
jgi:hypothetical protein